MAKFDSKEILHNFKKYSEDATSKVKSSANNAKNIAGTVVSRRYIIYENNSTTL